VDVLQHEDQRGAATDRGEEIRERAVQSVALRVRIGRDRWRQLSDHPRKIRQQPDELAAGGAEIGPERLRVARPHERVERLHERPVRSLDDRVAGAVEHQRSARRRLVGELPHEPALAGAGLSADEGEAQAVTVRRRDQRPQGRQLARASGEGKRRGEAEWSGKREHRGTSQI
jgi:hypothetical protein